MIPQSVTGPAAIVSKRSKIRSSKVRYLDKLVDDLAKGKTMEKVLRK